MTNDLKVDEDFKTKTNDSLFQAMLLRMLLKYGMNNLRMAMTAVSENEEPWFYEPADRCKANG